MAHVRLLQSLLASFGLVLLGTACGSESPKRANVLLISLDSTRRDMLSLYGYKSVRAPEASNTPHLEALAAGGVVMEEAYSSCSWTLPSHVSMLLGQSELVHSVDLDHQRPNSKFTPLPEILQDAGYRTAGFYSGPYLEPQYGFERGFDLYKSCYGNMAAQSDELLRYARHNLKLAEESGDAARIVQAKDAEKNADHANRKIALTTVSSEVVTDAVLTELEDMAAGDAPFFLFAHYFDPHYDYVAPEPFNSLFDPEYQSTTNLEDFLDNPTISVRQDSWPFRRQRVVSDRDLEHILSLYAGEIAWTDAQLGRIFGKLEELGLAEDTLIVVTSDHGDEFFEHDGIGHRSTLFEELVQVPMVLRFPGRLPAGERRSGLVSTVDIVPTVLELLDIEAPANLSSSSFLNVASGESKGYDRFLFNRLVRNTFGRVFVPGQEEVDVLAMRLTLLETYRAGSIKITRERSWATMEEELAPDLAAAFEKQANVVRDREILHWIDLEHSPEEALEDHSEDFKNPRAAAALKSFQEHYTFLLSRRERAQMVEASAEGSSTSALEALGYTGAGAGGSDLSNEEKFVFPPPGENL
ncbi:MAG: arylsulfatase A-like enzyme [Planctomycetota bacterium]|jgi:arylsulfatase A-like enzyme